MITHEKWKAVPGYEGLHEVSDRGSVRSLDRIDSLGRLRKGKVLSPSQDRDGYLRVGLSKDGKRKGMLVHRLVLLAFVGPCPDGMEACHFNDIPDDNRLTNLRWGTPSANNYDSVRNGSHYWANRTHCPNEHEYTPENTYIPPSGKRNCRECQRIRLREYRRLNAEKISAARRSNPEKIKAYNREYYRLNAERIKAARRSKKEVAPL